MILVTGATGQLGTAVIKNLLEKTSANQIAAFVHDESKASDLTILRTVFKEGCDAYGKLRYRPSCTQKTNRCNKQCFYH